MRRWLLPLLALVVALSGSATAQDRIYRIGVLSPTGAGSGFTSISTITVPELATLGFVEGRNLVLEYRSAGGVLDRLPALAQELVQKAPDVIVANGPPAIRAARQATGTIPIVMSFTGEDPVAAGWIASLARPGGNITGLVLLGPELDGKRLELLHEAVPDRRRIAVLVEPGVTEASLKAMRPVAQTLGLELLMVPVHDGNYAAAFETIRSMSAGALAVPPWVGFTLQALPIQSGSKEVSNDGWVRAIMLLPHREEHDMKSIVLGVACACVALSAQAQQKASPPSPLILKEITTNFPKADQLEARVETATLEPGKIGGWHTHPTPVVVYVIEGTLTVEIKGKDPIVTKAGEAYLEPINTVMRATNKGQTPLRFVAFQVSPPEVPDSQPAPEN